MLGWVGFDLDPDSDPENGLILVRIIRYLLLLRGGNKVNQPKLEWSWVGYPIDNYVY